MSTAIEHASAGPPEDAGVGARGKGSRPGAGDDARFGVLRRHPWPFAVAAIAVFSFLLVRWARTSPGYDPYGWLVWGYQALRLHLNLDGAPSWKPFTFLFTVPYSVVGHLSWWLWVVTAVTVALCGPLVAARIVHRLVLRSTGERWPALVAAVVAALCLLGIVEYTHYWLSAQSDPMLVTLFLLAIDMHLLARHRTALTCLWLCSLGRPEAWPFFGLYFLWTLRFVPRMRVLAVIELLLIPAFWFGIPVLCGNYWDIAGKLAQNSPRELHSDKVIGTLNRFRELSYWPVQALAVFGLVLAALRRDWRVLGVAACAVVWMAVEVAFAVHGFPGVPRYMFEAAGAMIVVAGIGFGWLIALPSRLLRERFETAEAPRPAIPRWSPGAARVVSLALAIAFVAVMVPNAVTGERIEHDNLLHERQRTSEIKMLNTTISKLGGYRFIRSCGKPAADIEWDSILAWYTKLNVGEIGHKPQYIVTSDTKPAVLFTALPNGWIVRTYHLRPDAPAACRSINGALYVATRSHPGGVLERPS